MWKEKSEERLERYKEILRDAPLFLKAADQAKETETARRADGPDNEKEYSGEDISENVSYYCLAPALCACVVWLLENALKAGIKRLYFLARDAYFMYETALKFCSACSIPIDCRYLSCSRYSVRIPMYHLDMDEALGYICRGGIDVTMEKILNRAGLSPSEKEAVMEELGSAGVEYGREELIPYAELSAIRAVLEKSTLFMEYTVQNSKRAMPLLKGYLIQEGLTDDVPMALADSGWVGSMQKILNRAVEYIKKEDAENIHGDKKKNAKEGAVIKPFQGYYWGLYELPDGVNPESYHCYYFSPGYNMAQKVYFSNCLFETVFSAPHGMTLGYKEENGRYFPVYGDISKDQKAFMETVGARLLLFADKLISALKETPSQARAKSLLPEADKKVIYRLLRCFMGNPCPGEAEIFGRLHFSDDVLDYKSQELAADLSQKELNANHAFNKILSMAGIKKGFLRESAWYEASAVLSGSRVSHHLRGYAVYKRLLYLRKQRSWRKMYG